MSKASAWAARDKARLEKLEAARERIEDELGRDGKDKPGPFLSDASVLAEVAHYGGTPRLVFRAYSSPPSLGADRAVEFARWIIATFGEVVAPASVEPGETAS